MIKVCIADSLPVVHFGVKSYFKDHDEISISANVGSFLMIRDILLTKEIDVLVFNKVFNDSEADIIPAPCLN